MENSVRSQGYNLIAGIDEAGRGPLAGPVVAACVVIPVDFKINGSGLEEVRDSKKLSALKRQTLAEKIRKRFSGIGLGICDHVLIDRINILEAAFLAMKKAIGALRPKPDYLLVDGHLAIPNLSLPQKPVTGGDGWVFSIAAASIVAKVERDRIMSEWDEKYPLYGFKRHKGYGTKNHLVSLKEHGPCPIHRRSFSPIKEMIRPKR